MGLTPRMSGGGYQDNPRRAAVRSIQLGFQSKVQVIERANKTRQFYFICPAPLAEAMEFEKGEIIEWVVVDKRHISIKRERSSGQSLKSVTK